MSNILKCERCGKYSMERYCSCGGECFSTRPPKYSPDDKYGKYRLEYKKKSKNI